MELQTRENSTLEVNKESLKTAERILTKRDVTKSLKLKN